MAADNLPGEVIRVLSFHGPVSWWVGRDGAIARGEAAVAPFEDVVCLFVSARSPCVAALDRDTFLRLVARAPGGEYQLRVDGRAVAGLPLGRHPRRHELSAWAPEDASLASTIVVTMVPEFIELSRGEADARERFVGPTPAGRARGEPLALWLRAGSGGLAAGFAAVHAVGVWVWLGLAGPDFPARPLALVLSLAAGQLPLFGARLVTQAMAFRRWQRGEVEASEAPVLVDGLIAAGAAQATGLALSGVGLVLLVVVGAIWGARLMGLTFALSGVWVLVPVWLLHLTVSQPKR